MVSGMNKWYEMYEVVTVVGRLVEKEYQITHSNCLQQLEEKYKRN